MSAPTVSRPVIFPFGVAEPAARAAYVTVDDAALVALDLRDGRPRWRLDYLARPLLAAGDRLIVATVAEPTADKLVIQVLDARRAGAIELVSQPLDLPDWVPSQLMPSDEFDYSVLLIDATLRLRWRAQQRYRGGAPPPPTVLAAARRQADGLIDIDLTTGQARLAPGDSEPRPELPLATQPDAPWRVDDQMVSLRLAVVDAAVRVALARTPPAGESTLVELASGAGLVAEVTPDGRYVAVHDEQLTSPDGATAWSIFAVPGGESVARVSRPRGAGRPVVIADSLYYTVERMAATAPSVHRLDLEARELATDRRRWVTELTRRTIRRAPPPRP